MVSSGASMPWLGWLITGLSQLKPGLNSRWSLVAFAVDKVALGRVILQVLRCSSVTITPPVLPRMSFMYNQ